MAKIDRIIIDTKGDLLLQVKAAQAALSANINLGELMGVRCDGKYFGVKCNKRSIRIYCQEDQ